MTLARASRSAPSSSSSRRLGPPLALAAGAVLLAPTLVRPSAHGPVLCPLRRVTGVWCPSCGMTRAVGWLVHGDLHQSLRYHPLAPLLVVQGVLLGAFWLYRRRTRHDRQATSVLSAPIMRTVLVANALLVLLVWVIRLKSGSFDDLG